MPPTHWAFSIRRGDLERLFGARRICYLIGGYDGSGNYGDIVQLAANLERLSSPIGGILLVPLISRLNLQSHDDLCREHPSLFGEACFTYYTLRYGSEDFGADALDGEDFVDLDGPPPAYSHILIYGGGFFNEWWGPRVLDVIEALQKWLSIGQAAPQVVSRPLILGQQISGDFVPGSQARRFSELLECATAIGVRDTISFDVVARQCNESIRSKLFVSGDDAASYIAARSWPSAAGGARSGAAADRRPAAFTVNLHLSLETYVTDDASRLLDVAASIARDLRDLRAGSAALNLIAAFEDRRISETRYLTDLKESLGNNFDIVNVINCTSEILKSFPLMSRANVTIACSYHVAMTSLILSIPTVLLYANDYYAHKHQGLRDWFLIPDEMVFDVNKDDYDKLAKTLRAIIVDHNFRTHLGCIATQAAARMVMNNSNATVLLSEWLTNDYIAGVEEKYHSTVENHLQTLQQLSEVQGLVNGYSNAQLLRVRAAELEALVEERTAWAQRSVEAVTQRDSVIRYLQAQLEGQVQVAGSHRPGGDSLTEVDGRVAERDRLIRDLQAQLDSIRRAKLWRAVSGYWALRRKLRQLGPGAREKSRQ